MTHISGQTRVTSSVTMVVLSRKVDHRLAACRFCHLASMMNRGPDRTVAVVVDGDSGTAGKAPTKPEATFLSNGPRPQLEPHIYTIMDMSAVHTHSLISIVAHE